MLCISNMNEQYREYWREHYGKDYDKEPSETSKMIMIQQYPILHQRIKKIQIETSDKALFQENQKLKKKLEESEYVEVELFQENDRLKKELESLKQFELDRILDASMNEIFTTEPLLLF